MKPRIEQLYEEDFGVEALERQLELAKDYCTCCGERRGGEHHRDCAKYVEPVAAVHEDQGSLL